MEAFTSRFVRLVDLLTQKVLRALFDYELEPVETVLDRLNLAEKRGFVAHAEDLERLKEQRNIIAHDYAGAKADRIFAFCRDHWAELEAICDHVGAYGEVLLTAKTPRGLIPLSGETNYNAKCQVPNKTQGSRSQFSNENRLKAEGLPWETEGCLLKADFGRDRRDRPDGFFSSQRKN